MKVSSLSFVFSFSSVVLGAPFAPNCGSDAVISKFGMKNSDEVAGQENGNSASSGQDPCAKLASFYSQQSDRE
jgi:hypothetical protein